MRRSKLVTTALAVFASAAGACPFCDQQYGNSPQGQADRQADRQAAVDRARAAFVARFKDADVSARATSRGPGPTVSDVSHAATYYPAAAEESSSGSGRSGMNLPLDL